MKLLDHPTPSETGLQRMKHLRGEPLFLAGWERILMLHFAVDVEALQTHVPFKLDTYDGLAYVSLVAFTLREMHFRHGGIVGRWLLRPIATHEFLNVRTYVKHRGEPGIYFLSEWLPNALSVALGKPLFGLPYRLGKLRYQHPQRTGNLNGTVSTPDGKATLDYLGHVDGGFEASTPGSLHEFLLERYTAFTHSFGIDRLFRVWHPPWQHAPAAICLRENTLMDLEGHWTQHAGFVGATYSPGFDEVWMSRPRLA
ncbi:DUF2071 domain-containing protein [Phragmitibacter flavus]|uniref:DUF2071 domain-containing protein n=1 Tax=Phragmitibacter flavus TaxID=2576071 RepID=A0A5R8KKW2_9BACT|nr:DUF2071 domain-containing protein [Phragmitibacter flavus]TLD72615.1 DUF2071 domain-containing protein [Phragmitibacter flavus]